MVPGSEFAVAGWQGTARTRISGQFSYCVIRRAYPNGVELSLARSPEGLFFIGLKNTAWVLQKGDEAKAQVIVDQAAGPGPGAAAMAISSDTVLFTFLPRDAAAYAGLLSTGTWLTVAGLSLTPQTAAWHFDLAGTHEALDALGRCVADHETTASTE